MSKQTAQTLNLFGDCSILVIDVYKRQIRKFDVDAYDVRLEPLKVSDGGIVMVSRKNVEGHALERSAHGLLQIGVILHHKRRAPRDVHKSRPR